MLEKNAELQHCGNEWFTWLWSGKGIIEAQTPSIKDG
jgi:hypothetical protein